MTYLVVMFDTFSSRTGTFPNNILVVCPMTDELQTQDWWNKQAQLSMALCWGVKTLTACRTECQTLRSVYWAGGDTGQPRMSASDLFSPQLLSVAASCLKQTILVAVQIAPPGNFDNFDCFCFTKPVNVNVVLVSVLLLFSSSCCHWSLL